MIDCRDPARARGMRLRLLGRAGRPCLHPVLGVLRRLGHLASALRVRRLPPRRLGGLPGPDRSGRRGLRARQLPQRLQRRRCSGGRLGLGRLREGSRRHGGPGRGRVARAPGRARLDALAGHPLRLGRKPRRSCDRGITGPRARRSARNREAGARRQADPRSAGPAGGAAPRGAARLPPEELALRPGGEDHAAREHQADPDRDDRRPRRLFVLDQPALAQARLYRPRVRRDRLSWTGD